MLSAADHNVERMAKDEPSTRVGIVCFDSFVHVYGDGTQPMFTLWDVDNEE